MNDGNGSNPAWKPILDVLPESLHGIVTPVLKQWDQGVQNRFQEIHNEYSELEPFKKFVANNIDPAYVEQAVILADQLQRDPATVVANMNEAWQLGFVSKEEAEKLGQSSSPSGDGSDDFLVDEDSDIFNDPRVKAMKESLDKIQNEFEQEKQSETEQQQIAEFEEYLDGLEKSFTSPEREGGPLPFNRMFVTALISQGLSGEDAVKQYHEALAIASSPPDETNNSSTDETVNQPPAVMGNQGTVGSGSSDNTINPGALSRSDLNSTVQSLLKASFEDGN